MIREAAEAVAAHFDCSYTAYSVAQRVREKPDCSCQPCSDYRDLLAAIQTEAGERSELWRTQYNNLRAAVEANTAQARIEGAAEMRERVAQRIEQHDYPLPIAVFKESGRIQREALIVAIVADIRALGPAGPTSVGERVAAHPLFPKMFEESPCVLCGYNGSGYYQPNEHPCARIYHDHVNGKVKARKLLGLNALTPSPALEDER